MKNDLGLVSVIVPVYNRARLVTETVASILGQTYQNIEIILINDGSTDDSLKVVQALQQESPDVIRIIDQENQGQTVARNQGIKHAREIRCVSGQRRSLGVGQTRVADTFV